MLRRSAGAVVGGLVVLVLPFVLGSDAALRRRPNWLMRLSPTARVRSPGSPAALRLVTDAYTPVNGYYPLAPWAGLAVSVATARSL